MSRTSVLLSPRRPSEIQLSLADVTGPGGISLIEPSYDPNGTFDTNDASSIAPWSEPAEEPPTPPSKGSTSSGKFSIPGLGKSLRGRTGSTETRQPTLSVSETFTNMASASSLTLDSQYSQPRHRNHSNLSVSVTHPAGDGSSPVNLSPHPPSPDRSRTTLRQKVSKSLFKRSKSRLRDSPRNSEDSIIPPVPTNDYGTTTMMSNVSTMTLPLHGEPSVNGKKDSHSSGKSGKKSKSLFKSPSGMLSTDVVSSTLKEKSEPGVYYTLDQDLENMSDIVDTSKAPTDPALTLTSQASTVSLHTGSTTGASQYGHNNSSLSSLRTTDIDDVSISPSTDSHFSSQPFYKGHGRTSSTESYGKPLQPHQKGSGGGGISWNYPWKSPANNFHNFSLEPRSSVDSMSGNSSSASGSRSGGGFFNRHGAHPGASISPKSISPFDGGGGRRESEATVKQPSRPHSHLNASSSSSSSMHQPWTAPDSWAVELEDGDGKEDEAVSSDEGDGAAGQGGGGSGGQGDVHMMFGGEVVLSSPTSPGPPVPPKDISSRRRRRKKPVTPTDASRSNMTSSSAPFGFGGSSRGSLVPSVGGLGGRLSGDGGRRGSMKKEGEVFRLRFYRLDRGYHVVSLPIHATVAHVTPALISRLTGNSEAHRLYLQERGKERILASTDKPAGIVRRRMEQAGYDLADGLDLLADDGLNFLLRFVWKTQLLGGVDEERDFKLDSFEFIDLTARGLRTIPVSLHKNSESIVFLKLNRNPMLDIPLDFIQSCTQLREIRLSHMAMKKVPLSLRYCLTLHYLDLSCNRIADLDEAYLDNIPDLRSLTIQNNRIEKLPWHFSRLRALLTLNISNNKFKEMPPVITQLEALRDLDISFNMISELPEDLDHLRSLERFILVSNQIVRFPDCASNLLNLKELDCRRNLIGDLSMVSVLPKLEKLSAEYNNVASLDMSIGPKLAKLDASHNDLTKLTLTPGPTQSLTPYALTLLDISHAKLASLDDFALARLSGLEVLKLSHNMFTSIPETVGDLVHLEQLECSDNHLLTLPSSIGRLQRLERLDAHNNSIPEVPITLWQCPALRVVNLTSNMLEKWLDPPLAAASTTAASVVASSSASAVMALSDGSLASERKASASSLGTTHASSRTTLPPLAHSLERLYLGENNLTEDGLLTLTLTRELRVLNLSFNDLQELPTGLFRHLTNLEELYMSGNKLTNLQPADDLPKMHRLSTLFLNGNRLQNLPQELGQVPNLVVLDVGSNMLKYNINNTEWDWNWNFNKSLKYLNLSGNDRLQIKPPASRSTYRQSRDLSHMVGFNSKASSNLSGFSALSQLRVLGLMDVMIATGGLNRGVDIPEETDERRVRTSMSVINGMSYGIADTLGKNQQLNMLDLVYEYRDRPGQAVFAMFGRALPPKHVPPGASTNKLAKFLHDNFIDTFNGQLDAVRHNPGISRTNQTPDALRRTFLKLNQDLHGYLYNSTRKGSAASAAAPVDPTVARSGASGVVLYFMGAQLWVANAGNALAVISRRGIAEALTRHHVPYDRQETERIRAAEGWISPPGLINDELDISRSFGFYHLLPVVNSRPDIRMRDLTDSDEFIIVGNRGLWDYVSYQTAVDIARQELDLPTEGGRMRRADLAAQKLRDFALSYGAEGSTMIMVISVADLFSANTHRSRQATIDSVDSPIPSVPRVKKPRINRELDRLRDEVDPPTGHVTLAFTDIRNSTPLWEANPGMPAAMKIHNTVLRRYLRICGGYEVKTEGDAFMCAFPNTLSALWWCLICQLKLLEEPWPLEILIACSGWNSEYGVKGPVSWILAMTSLTISVLQAI